MSKEMTIPNWTVFGSHSITIEIHEAGMNDEDEIIYQAGFGILLNNGEHTLEETVEMDVDNQQHITIMTELFDTNTENLAIRAGQIAAATFDGVNQTAFVFEENKISNELDLQKLIEDHSGSSVQIH